MSKNSKKKAKKENKANNAKITTQQETPNWANVIDAIRLIKTSPKFKYFDITYDSRSSELALDYLDEGIDLTDSAQLYCFLCGAIEPLKMMFMAYEDGDLEFEQIEHVYYAFSAVLTASYNYLPTEYFSEFYKVETS
jgi:hypothetical protein